MNSISIFLKNRQINKLLEQIEFLKVKSAIYEKKFITHETTAKQILEFIELHKTNAANGISSSTNWLSNNLSQYLSTYSSYLKKAKRNYIKYEKTEKRIALLKEQFENIVSALRAT